MAAPAAEKAQEVGLLREILFCGLCASFMAPAAALWRSLFQIENSQTEYLACASAFMFPLAGFHAAAPAFYHIFKRFFAHIDCRPVLLVSAAALALFSGICISAIPVPPIAAAPLAAFAFTGFSTSIALRGARLSFAGAGAAAGVLSAHAATSSSLIASRGVAAAAMVLCVLPFVLSIGAKSRFRHAAEHPRCRRCDERLYDIRFSAVVAPLAMAAGACAPLFLSRLARMCVAAEASATVASYCAGSALMAAPGDAMGRRYPRGAPLLALAMSAVLASGGCIIAPIAIDPNSVAEQIRPFLIAGGAALAGAADAMLWSGTIIPEILERAPMCKHASRSMCCAAWFFGAGVAVVASPFVSVLAYSAALMPLVALSSVLLAIRQRNPRAWSNRAPLSVGAARAGQSEPPAVSIPIGTLSPRAARALGAVPGIAKPTVPADSAQNVAAPAAPIPLKIVIRGNPGTGRKTFVQTMEGQKQTNSELSATVNEMNQGGSSWKVCAIMSCRDTGIVSHNIGWLWKSSRVALIFFSITDEASFKSVRDWHKECKMFCPDGIRTLLIGTKRDCEAQRVVSRELAETESKFLDSEYFEIDCRQLEEIERVIRRAIDLVIEEQPITPNVQTVIR